MTTPDTTATAAPPPSAQHGRRGLYDPAFEKDSCGFGIIANMDNVASHWLVQTALVSLTRLEHRGATAADGKTGDGCGILLKQPTEFLRAVATEAGIGVANRFAAGLVFLSPFGDLAERCKAVIARELEQEGLKLAGWRPVPTRPDACGEQALKTLPRIEQLFVDCPREYDETTFNRRLYVVRRRGPRSIP